MTQARVKPTSEEYGKLFTALKLEQLQTNAEDRASFAQTGAWVVDADLEGSKLTKQSLEGLLRKAGVEFTSPEDGRYAFQLDRENPTQSVPFFAMISLGSQASGAAKIRVV